ncbi:MAG: MBG domain-containing protein, partial [Lentisphaeria bacterium]
VDYTLAYANNINAGTATLTVTGQGNYGGTKDKTFTINKATATVTPDAGQNKVQGTADPELTYTVTGVVAGETPAFSGALARAVGETVGTYEITQGNLALRDNGAFLADNYTLAFTGGVTFAIAANDASTLAIADIAPLTYNGAAHTPEPEVKDGNTVLIKDTHYTLTYANNINAGTATLTVTGQGNYGGTQDKTFTIIAKDASALTIADIAPVTYNGAAHTPEPEVTDDITVLVKGTDYTLTYANNTNAGTATVTLTGQGNYSGTQDKIFTINKATPTLTWATPAPLVAGMTLSGTQLNAAADIPGAFSYEPAAGTALPAGTHTLKAAFTPDDVDNWDPATTEVELRVAAGTVMWLTADTGNGEAPITLAFGEAETAALAEDAFDVAAVPGQRVSLGSLPISTVIRHLSHDFRPFPDESGITRWRLVIVAPPSAGENHTVTLTWDVSAAETGRLLYLQQIIDERPVGEPIDMMWGYSSVTINSGTTYEIAYAPLSEARLSLQHGWNLIGLPVMYNQIERRGNESLSRSSGSRTILWYWENGIYKLWPWDKSLSPEVGYFFYHHDADETITIRGIQTDGVMLLQPGWNLVSPPSDGRMPIAADGGGVASQAWRLHGNAYQRVGSGDVLKAGCGYWIFVQSDQPIMVNFGN